MAFPLSNKLLKQKETLLEGTIKLKVFKAVMESMLVSFSVALFTLPITTYYFGYISAVSALTNLIIFPVSMPLVVGTGLFTLTSTLPLVSTILGVFCRYISELVIAIVSFMGSLSFAKIHLDYNFLFPFLIFAGVGLFLIAMVKSKCFKQVTAIALVLIFTIQFTTEYVLHLTTHRINHFSDSCYIVTVRGKGVIIGLSGDYYIYENVVDYIERKY
jgi:competence protein ComEC